MPGANTYQAQGTDIRVKPIVKCKGFIYGRAFVGQPALIIRGDHPELGPGPSPCRTSTVIRADVKGFETLNTYYEYDFDTPAPNLTLIED